MGINRKIIIPLLVSLALVGCGQPQEKPAAPKPVSNNYPDAEIKAVLKTKLEILEKLAQDQIIIDATVASSNKTKNQTEEQLQEVENEWSRSTSEDTQLIKDILTNDIALALVRIEENFPGFTEIFITDSQGIVFASTLKTTDYIQSDEEWWQKCYADGQGESFYSELSYDVSASSEGMSLQVPVINDGTAIGCIKGFFDVTALYHEILTM